LHWASFNEGIGNIERGAATQNGEEVFSHAFHVDERENTEDSLVAVEHEKSD